jgi:biopolymer transport protein ExbD
MIPRPPRPNSMELNLAPMVDVIMCLIIFFLLASQMVSAENLPLKLPFAVAAKEVEMAELGARVVINIRKLDEETAEYVVVRLEPKADGGMDLAERVLTAEEIEGFLKGVAARAAERKEKLTCVIRADQECMYRDIEVVLRGCGLAKIQKITFSAKQGEEPTES